MKPRPFQVIDGQRDEATFACTWCAARFLTRQALTGHWATSPRCKRNRAVSNQTQTKYNVIEPSEE